MEGGLTLYKAIDLSKYIVTKCIVDGCAISNLQLQKILYYVQKDFLQRDFVAFSDDIEAWQFGPIVPVVYYKFCGFGAMPITSTFEVGGIDSLDLQAIDHVVDTKKSLNPWDLVADTHRKNGAWDQIYQNGLGNHNIIPRSLIKTEG